jgi:hypothetical protein
MAAVQVDAHAKAFSFKQEFAENFDVGKPYDLLGMSTDLLTVFYGVTVDKIEKFISRNCADYINYWNNQTVNTQEHGKQARAIMNSSVRKHSKTKQADFIVRLSNYAVVQMRIYALADVLKKDYDESFDTGEAYDLASLTQEELDSFGVSVSGVGDFIDNNCADYVDFWTNQAVAQADHGQYARAVMNNATYIK